MSDAQIAPNGHVHPCPQWWDDAGADDGCTCGHDHTARPVGGDTREALREAIAEAYARWAEHPFEPADWQRENGRQVADAVLALPAVRAALDAQETVRRVRRVSEEWGAEDGVRHLPASRILGDLRRALAGDS